MASEGGAGAGPATPDLVVRQLRRRHFAVLATVGRLGAPHSAGVSYGCTGPGDRLVIYVMTRRHLLKSRDIASDPRVSMVVPVPRSLLTFLPPATMQLHGRAELLDWDDPGGTAVFESFWMGRRILRGYAQARARGERRVCFVRIVPEPRVHTYMVGSPIWRLRRNMEAGAADVTLDPRR
jgi:hypothetical protein